MFYADTVYLIIEGLDVFVLLLGAFVQEEDLDNKNILLPFFPVC